MIVVIEMIDKTRMKIATLCSFREIKYPSSEYEIQRNILKQNIHGFLNMK